MNDNEFENAVVRVKNAMINAFLEWSSPDNYEIAFETVTDKIMDMSVAYIMKLNDEIQDGNNIIFSTTYQEFNLEF